MASEPRQSINLLISAIFLDGFVPLAMTGYRANITFSASCSDPRARSNRLARKAFASPRGLLRCLAGAEDATARDGRDGMSGMATAHRVELLPPTYWFGCVLLMVAAHALIPLFHWAWPPFTYLGFVIIAAAFVLAGWAAWTFRSHGTPIHPFESANRLVTEGPYRFARNPMYLSLMLVLAGIFVLLGSASPILVLILFERIISSRFIGPEEQALERRFGDDFRRYKARVRRWV